MVSGKTFELIGTSLCFFENDQLSSCFDLKEKFQTIQALYYLESPTKYKSYVENQITVYEFDAHQLRRENLL